MIRRGDWFQTYTGIKFYPYDPRPDEICLKDIAHHLSLQCRYNGAVREFYSVAEHCIRVSQILLPELAAWGLMHDAAEAYLGDMVRPVKLGMPQYREAETLVMTAVAARFGLSLPEPPEVKTADNVLLHTERRDLLLLQRKWSQQVTPLPDRIEPWSPSTAETLFLDTAASKGLV